MFHSSWAHFLSIFDTLVYVALTSIGFYFIYEGEVIQKYSSGRTNYAEYDEPITELPTIVFSLDGDSSAIDKWKYGTNFRIEMQNSNHAVLTDPVNLKIGKKQNQRNGP